MQRTLLVFAIGLGAGIGAALFMRPSAPPDDTRASLDALREDVASLRAETGRAPASVRTDVIEHVVREGVRSELAVAANEPPREGAAETETPAVEESDTEALLATLSLITAAEARGRWTSSDVEAFRMQLSTLPGPDQIEAVNQLAVAINERRLRLEPGVHRPL
jgi:hypothetical protein